MAEKWLVCVSRSQLRAPLNPDPHSHPDLHFQPMAMAVKVSDRGRLLRF